MNALYKPLFGNRSISVATRAITNERNATTATTFCHDVFFVSLISDLMSYCNEKKIILQFVFNSLFSNDHNQLAKKGTT